MTSLKKNVLTLSLLQAATYVLPLLVIPYLVRVLGAQAYGRVAFAQAFMQYFVLLSDYGFNLTATQQVAVQRRDPIELSRIFWTTITTKALLGALGGVVTVVLIGTIPQLADSASILALSFLSVIGTILFPVWFFQGIERMAPITVATLLARFAIVPLTFLLVKSPGDVKVAAAIQGCSALLSGVIALALLRRERLVRWHCPTWSAIGHSLASGWHVFSSMAAVSLYTTSNTVILRFVAGEKAVGYFTAVNQIRVAASGLSSPISQSVYPRINALIAQSKDEAFALIRKTLAIQGGGMLAVSTTLFVTAPLVVRFAFGAGLAPAVPALYWLAPVPFVVGLSNVFGVQTMLPLGMKSTFSRIVSAAGIANVFMAFLLSRRFAATGTAISVLLTESAVALAMATVLVHKRIPIFRMRRLEQESACAIVTAVDDSQQPRRGET